MLYKSILICTFSVLALATAVPSPDKFRDISIEQLDGKVDNDDDNNGRGNFRANFRDNGKHRDNDDDNDDDDAPDVLVIALFNSINTNIIIQQTEQTAVLALIDFMTSPDRANRDIYDELRNNLVVIIAASASVREGNERMAEKVGVSDDAREGFKAVAEAQGKERGLLEGMTGEAENDLAILDELLEAFEGDAKQNRRNQQMVLLG